MASDNYLKYPSSYLILAILIAASIIPLWRLSRKAESEFASFRHLAERNDGTEAYVLETRIDPKQLPQIEGGPFSGSPTYYGRPERGNSQDHKMILYFANFFRSESVPDVVKLDAPQLPLTIKISSTWYTSMSTATIENRDIPVLQVRKCEIVQSDSRRR